MADVIRLAGIDFVEQNRHWLSAQQRKVLWAIQHCRTATLGGHRDECPQCGHHVLTFNSCRNRHCPQCQTHAQRRWLHARRQQLLPTAYAHLVFTVPPELHALARQNQKLFYDLLFRATAQTLHTVAADPQHLGARVGFFSVLHTWTQKLQYHPHVHCVAPAGGLSPDHNRWIHSHQHFFLPVKVLSRVFRGKLVALLKRAFSRHQLSFHGRCSALAQPQSFAAFLRTLFRHDWVVYCKPPFVGPEQVLNYLGAYTHRIAISDHRLVSLAPNKVTFRWRDRAHGNRPRKLTLPLHDFLRRFLLHVLPYRFVRIRHYGFLCSRHCATLWPVCASLLAPASTSVLVVPAAPLPKPSWPCPRCGSPLRLVERLSARQIQLRSPPEPKESMVG
jgi:Putative transposase/Transposase zinc-binding domain